VSRFPIANRAPRGHRVLRVWAAGNIATQEIAGFSSSVVTWTRHDPSAEAIGRRHDPRTTSSPDPRFNPVADLLARIVCHDSAGVASEAARTRTVSFPESGDARLVDAVSLPEDCFAPIVLLTGSLDPQGESPGKFFAVSGF
jgi:hypothetical protein